MLEIALLVVLVVATVVVWFNLTGGDGGSGLDGDELESLLATEEEVNADIPAASAGYRPVTDGSEAVTPRYDFSGIEDHDHRYAQCEKVRRHLLPGGSATATRAAFRNEQSGALVIHTLGLVGEGTMSVEEFETTSCYSLFTVQQGALSTEGLEDSCGTDADGLGDEAASFGLELYRSDPEGQTDTGTRVLCGLMVQRADVVSTVIVTAGTDDDPNEDRVQALAEAIDERLRQAVEG